MDLSFLDFEPDFSSSAVLAAYDELPLWSAMFGLLLLDEVPLTNVRAALDVGCGTGFPLIELAERLGPGVDVHGVDTWSGALTRAWEKIAARGTPNVTLHECSAASMPFADASFDLIVSNLGVNNFDDRDAAIAECRRVARPGATIALTTNLQGHMQELYDVFAEVLTEDGRRQLEEHVRHRATVPGVRDLLERHRFTVTRVVERTGIMRFGSGEALFHHHFIKLGFLDAWKKIVPRDAFPRVLERLGSEIRLTIPMAYFSASAS